MTTTTTNNNGDRSHLHRSPTTAVPRFSCFDSTQKSIAANATDSARTLGATVQPAKQTGKSPTSSSAIIQGKHFFSGWLCPVGRCSKSSWIAREPVRVADMETHGVVGGVSEGPSSPATTTASALDQFFDRRGLGYFQRPAHESVIWRLVQAGVVARYNSFGSTNGDEQSSGANARLRKAFGHHDPPASSVQHNLPAVAAATAKTTPTVQPKPGSLPPERAHRKRAQNMAIAHLLAPLLAVHGYGDGDGNDAPHCGGGGDIRGGGSSSSSNRTNERHTASFFRSRSPSGDCNIGRSTSRHTHHSRIQDPRPPPLVVVDFCGGSGHTSLALAAIWPEVRFVVVDFNATALRICAERASSQQLSNVSTLCTDIAEFPPPGWVCLLYTSPSPRDRG